MCQIHAAWLTDRIILYVESGEGLLQVVGNEDVVGDKGVVSEDDVGDEGGELSELVCYGWMNDELKGLDFTNDIFGGNEGHWKTKGSQLSLHFLQTEDMNLNSIYYYYYY